MTHDELLAKIGKPKEEGYEYADIVFNVALRAVVEFHKPFMYEGRMGKFERCSGCSSEEEWLGEIYPCPTIQAITDNLK